MSKKYGQQISSGRRNRGRRAMPLPSVDNWAEFLEFVAATAIGLEASRVVMNGGGHQHDVLWRGLTTPGCAGCVLIERSGSLPRPDALRYGCYTAFLSIQQARDFLFSRADTTPNLNALLGYSQQALVCTRITLQALDAYSRGVGLGGDVRDDLGFLALTQADGGFFPAELASALVSLHLGEPTYATTEFIFAVMACALETLDGIARMAQ